jgi:hypothetical protein
MKKRVLLATVIIALVVVLPTGAAADTFDFAMGIKAGTPGLGVEANLGLLPTLNLRAGINGFQYSSNLEVNGIDYDYDLNLLNMPLLLDLYIFNGPFRISGGFVINGNEIDIVSDIDGELVVINDQAYRSDQVGDISGTLAFNDFSPYLGIGWGNAVGENNRFSISLDLGIIFQGGPQASLSADGPLSSDPGFQEDLEAEARTIETDTDNFDLYPVIALAFNLRFF